MKPRAILTTLCALGALTLSAGGALAKLPPLDDAAKAKAAVAAAKAAWAGKVDAFQLCRAQDRLVGYVQRTTGKVGAPVPTPACSDPGPFVYEPPKPAVAASAPAAEAKKP